MLVAKGRGVQEAGLVEQSGNADAELLLLLRLPSHLLLCHTQEPVEQGRP